MKQLNFIQKYGEDRFNFFPLEYFKVLEALLFEKEKPVKVLDIGCGPGNWSIAIAKYNENAEVIGIDINDDFLKLAEEYKKKFNCNNVKFYKLNHRNIGNYFKPESFDYIFAMSVLQYLNEKNFFENISKILKPNGKVLLFWTHGLGYYFKKIVDGMRRGLKDTPLWILPILRGLALQKAFGKGDHAVLFWKTKKTANEYGIVLEKRDLTSLCKKYYQKKFIFLPYIINIVGTKS